MKTSKRVPCALALCLALAFLGGCGGSNSRGGSGSTTQTPVPAIASISPASVTAGAAALTLDIKGTGFTSASAVDWNGQALASTLVSATEITASVPASGLSASAANLVTVVNPASSGGASVATTFNVLSPAPVLSAVSPRNVTAGQQTTITLTGSGFEANSIVQWNGVAHTPTFVDGNTLQVTLSAADLAKPGAGSLIVTNPDPNGSSSAPITLNVTIYPVPAVTAVTIKASKSPTGCPPLVATLTGTNLTFGSVVQANGKTIGNLGYAGTNSVSLPAGLVTQPGALTFAVVSPYQTTLVSDPYPYPTSSPTVLSLCASPNSATVAPASSFSLTVLPTEVNATGNETVALGALPSGITTSIAGAPLLATGTQLHLQSASTVAAGSYTLPLTGTAGSAMASASIPLTVSTSAIPGFTISAPLSMEIAISPGGSGSMQFTTFEQGGGNFDYDVAPSLSGMPTGVSATFSPSVFTPGQSFTVMLTAGANAPLAQNIAVTVTGTPAAAVPPASASFILDVAQAPGSLPTSRTDFSAIAGSPYGGVYDAAHGLIFVSNPSWNRIDVLSAITHQLVKRIPVIAPRGIDITQDNATVWVETAGEYIFAINTSTLAATQYTLPGGAFGSSGLPTGINVHDVLLALADGTLFVYFDDKEVGGTAQAAVFTPSTGQLNVLSNPVISAWTTPMRSGDGLKVYASNSEYDTGMQFYDVASKTLRVLASGTNFGLVQAVNHDGTVVILSSSSNGVYSTAAYDQNLSYLNKLPCTPNNAASLGGGVLYNANGTRLYEICSYLNQTVVIGVDPLQFGVLSTAPAMFTDPVGTSGFAGTSVPFGVDASGLIFALQNYGVAFEDASFTQNYISSLPQRNGENEYISTFAGPLAGGTQVNPYVFPSLIPDVWFGQTRGTVSTSSSSSYGTAISPPSTSNAVVNLKYNFPDGVQWFYPQLFSYGTNPEYAVTSGSGPGGGAAAQLLGYGLPISSASGSVTVGGTAATITTTPGQYPPLSGEPYPSTLLAYTLPAGKPGWADLQVTTPNGSGTLPQSIFYANSVTDYTSSDTFTNLLYDSKRNVVYLSAGDHIDVFSLANNSFATPLIPAARGASRQFTGMALTPDGTKLLAADLLDGSLAIINPDSPSATTAIPIAAPTKSSSSCTMGPLYVAATANNTAFVSIGGLPGLACPSYGTLYLANLTSATVTTPPSNTACGPFAFSNIAGVDASSDGSSVILPYAGTSCLYSSVSGTYSTFKNPSYYETSFGTISARGNVLFSNNTFGDNLGGMVGSFAQPIPYYGGPNVVNPPAPLLRPRLNSSGSLLYMPYANWVDVIDVAHASLRMRFALTQTISSTAGPIAIDTGGRTIFLITNKGLTVVDLGAAPLSIGSVGQQTAGTGSQVTVLGSGFDAQTTATLGSAAAAVQYTDQNTLILTVPAIAAGPYDLILKRSDGAEYTLENAILIR